MDKSQLQVSNVGQSRSSKLQSKSALKKMEVYPNYPSNNMCNYTHRICLRNKLQGYDYCMRHILYDKNAPFKQCSFVHPHTHKRCSNPAHKTERKDSLCNWHLKKILLKRKQLVSVCPRPETLDLHLD